MSIENLQKVKNKIDKRRNDLLVDVKLHAEMIRDMCEKLIKKIDTHGLRAYYSVNHDSLGRVRRLHKSCMELSLMRGFYDSLEKEIRELE